MSFELASAYRLGDSCWSLLLGRLWAVVRLGVAGVYFDPRASSVLRSLPWDRGSGSWGGYWGEMRYALGLYYLRER